MGRIKLYGLKAVLHKKGGLYAKSQSFDRIKGKR